MCLHRSRLHGRGMRAHENVFRDVKGILHVARRMILRQVQCLEVVSITLDFRALFDAVAHRHENAFDALHRDRQRMQMSQRLAPPGERHVNLLACKPRRERLFSERRTLLLQRSFDGGTRLVDDLPETRPLFGTELSHAALDHRKLAFFAEHLDANVVEL